MNEVGRVSKAAILLCFEAKSTDNVVCLLASIFTFDPLGLNEKTPFSDIGYLAKTPIGKRDGVPRRTAAYWWKE